MSVEIKVWSDYVCPFCMLAETPLTEGTAGIGVDIEWMPFELRPYPQPTLRPEDEYLPSIWNRVVYPMARRLGVDITLPTVSPQPYTARAFEGYQYAKDHGKGAEYTPRVLRAFFQENRDIGQIDVLTDIAGELGLDGDSFRSALLGGIYAKSHQDALRQARSRHITAVPTIIIGDRRLEGVPSADRVRATIIEAQDTVHERTAYHALGLPRDRHDL